MTVSYALGMPSVCQYSGTLVDATHTLPADPSDYGIAWLPVVGCTRLRCAHCHQLVRTVTGVRFVNENAKVDLAELFALEDLAASPLLKKAGQGRLYLCRCRRHLENDKRAVDDPEDRSTGQANVPWACEGHPPLTLPADVDGRQLTGASDAAAAVVAALGGTFPPGARKADQRRAYWPARLYLRVADDPVKEAIARAVAERMSDADPAVRSRAIQFFVSAEHPLGAARALELLLGDRALFAGVPDAHTGIRGDKTLEESLWRVAGPLIAAPGRARELARAEALAPRRGSGALYDALAAGDGEWLRANRDAVQAAASDAARPALDKLLK